MNRKQRKERLKWLNVGQEQAQNARAERLKREGLELIRKLERSRHREEVQVRWTARCKLRASIANNTPKTATGEW